MNAIIADAVEIARPILEAELKAFDADVEALIKKALRLQQNTLRLLDEAKIDIGQVGDAMGYFGAIHAGLGQTARGSQGLHAAAHEAYERFKKQSPGGDPTPQVSGGKVPPPPP